PGHAGEVYEVTGPRLMTFADIAIELSNATGRSIAYVQVPHEAFVAGVKESGAPKEVVWMLDYLFNTVLDGRNAHLTDGVQRALGRQPKDFADYASLVAATGLWKEAVLTV
ncbi:MAG: NmrA family transcriptional regulator, partial [Cyanobacteria bacterium P01_A01_bin.68]